MSLAEELLADLGTPLSTIKRLAVLYLINLSIVERMANINNGTLRDILIRIRIGMFLAVALLSRCQQKLIFFLLILTVVHYHQFSKKSKKTICFCKLIA
jgi:hypothetical protein